MQNLCNPNLTILQKFVGFYVKLIRCTSISQSSNPFGFWPGVKQMMIKRQSDDYVLKFRVGGVGIFSQQGF